MERISKGRRLSDAVGRMDERMDISVGGKPGAPASVGMRRFVPSIFHEWRLNHFALAAEVTGKLLVHILYLFFEQAEYGRTGTGH